MNPPYFTPQPPPEDVEIPDCGVCLDWRTLRCLCALRPGDVPDPGCGDCRGTGHIPCLYCPDPT